MVKVFTLYRVLGKHIDANGKTLSYSIHNNSSNAIRKVSPSKLMELCMHGQVINLVSANRSELCRGIFRGIHNEDIPVLSQVINDRYIEVPQIPPILADIPGDIPELTALVKFCWSVMQTTSRRDYIRLGQAAITGHIQGNNSLCSLTFEDYYNRRTAINFLANPDGTPAGIKIVTYSRPSPTQETKQLYNATLQSGSMNGGTMKYTQSGIVSMLYYVRSKLDKEIPRA